MTTPAITDLCDTHPSLVRVVAPILRDFGGVAAFSGSISTVEALEDNSRVREALQEAGEGRVLVVDGGGSLRCAMLGDNLAELAAKNGWSGIVVHGCVRDTRALRAVPVGVRAIAAHPMRSRKKGAGERDVPVTFGGVTFCPGEHLYADDDGIIVSSRSLV